MFQKVFGPLSMSDAGPKDNDGENNEDGNGDKISSNSLDRFLKAVADQRRRYVLYILADSDTDVTSLDELADEIAPDDPQFDDEERVKLILHHRDLPKLAEFGQLDYDSRQGTIRYHSSDAIENLLSYLRELEEQ